MNASIHFRADHELVARVIAEKLRRRTDRARIEDGFRVDPPRGEGRRAN
ncbi:hypothetical protein [Sphingomonas immobilis]|uniref:Uncharacterized protein n=1 Tax=Sphingomonas immobilis TaxID=3063997 RepID=A0ABT8ZUU3_9SPHN|nr:hypothetical protein [Sphingomonas sp. CA1-15]MDO7840904.1 hypothetical protein [Sphingomonas sp. CA1-15]